MEDPYDRLERTAERIVSRQTYEQQNRWGLLWVHALMGLTAGVQMSLWGSASNIEGNLGTWVRPVLAGIGFFGGLSLAVGLSTRPRSIPFEVVGLVLVGLWDLCMALGLFVARVRQDNFGRIPLGQPLEPGYVAAYPISVYGGLFALVLIHLWTLRRLARKGLKNGTH